MDNLHFIRSTMERAAGVTAEGRRALARYLDHMAALIRATRAR